MRVEMWINGRWTLVEVDESWWWGSEPEEEEKPKRRPTYRTFVIRRSAPVDEKAAEAVLDWLSGCSPR